MRPMSAVAHLAANVARLRAQRRLTQGQLATLACLHRTLIVQIEGGAANPRLETLRRLASALSTDVPSLLLPPPKNRAATRRRAA